MSSGGRSSPSAMRRSAHVHCWRTGSARPEASWISLMASAKDSSRRVVGEVVSDIWRVPSWGTLREGVGIGSGIRSLSEVVGLDRDIRWWMLMYFGKTSTEYWLSIL